MRDPNFCAATGEAIVPEQAQNEVCTCDDIMHMNLFEDV